MSGNVWERLGMLGHSKELPGMYLCVWERLRRLRMLRIVEESLGMSRNFWGCLGASWTI